MDTVTLFPDKPYVVDDQIEMTVLFIIEEWNALRKLSQTHVTLKLKTHQMEEEISVGPENLKFVWQGYEFEYLGGGRRAVEFRVKRTGK